jgi:hypothetical protein
MTTKTAAAAKAALMTDSSATKAAAPQIPTKASRLLAMLRRADGASIEELSVEFGWLQHTTRAALTGLRKKGHAIGKDKQGSVTVYRIAA